MTDEIGKPRGEVARPEGFEPPTSWFVAMRSIQLSYGRNILLLALLRQTRLEAGGERGIRTLDGL